jgi:hypothetical protein
MAVFKDAMLNGALLRDDVVCARRGAKQDESELIDRLLSGISQESLRIKDGSRGFAELMKRFFVNT